MKKKVAPAEELIFKTYSYVFKRQVLDSIENGQLSINQSAKIHGISRSTIQQWMQKFGNFEKKLKQMGGKSAQQEIKELRKRIKQLEAEKLIYETAFEVLDDELKIDTKKKYLPPSLQNFLANSEKK
jgi:transposase-like protein